MGKDKKEKEEAAVEEVKEVIETEAAAEVKETVEETKPETEAEAKEEAPEAEPEVKEKEEPEVEAKEEPAEVTDDTQILTEDMKAALEETEAEEITDAKIQAGINEAAEAFKVEQELNNTGDEIAEKVEPKVIPVQAAPRTADERRENSQINKGLPEKENKKMANNNREDAAEIKTVYVKEKQRTGWWKVVMLILTILITLTFMATALFAGIGAWQLHKIEQNQTTMQVPAPQNTDPYYGNNNGNNGGYGNSQYGNGGYYDDGYDYYDGYGYGADRDEDYSLDDILEYYGDDIEQFFGGNSSGNGNSGSGSGSNSFSDWFSDLFGSDDSSSGNTYGF